MLLEKNIAGEPVVLDLDRAPHIMIAGEAGTGKTTCINSMIVSMVKKLSPDELQLIIFDPHIVDFDKFCDLQHLRMSIICDAEKFADVLSQLCDEMNIRCEKLQQNEKLPHLVVVIGELADLMAGENKKEIETKIALIALKGRTAGIHLVISTGKPESVSGLIQVNVSTKFCFQTASELDSKNIINEAGAEKLLGQGDMLMQSVLFTERVQGSWISDEDIEKIIKGDCR